MAEFILPESDDNAPQAFLAAHKLTALAMERLNLRNKQLNPNEPPLTPEEAARLAELDDLLSGRKRNPSAGVLPADD